MTAWLVLYMWTVWRLSPDVRTLYMYGMREMHTCSHRSNYERHRLKLGSFIPFDNSAPERDIISKPTYAKVSLVL